MLGLLLTLTGGLVLAAPTTAFHYSAFTACPEILSCMSVGSKVMRNASYEECKTRVPRVYSAQAQCLLAGYQRVLQQRQCRCTPTSLIPLYIYAAPSTRQATKLIGCSMASRDAVPAGCVDKLPEQCRAALPYAHPRHLRGMVTGTCSDRLRTIKGKFAGCLTALRTADLSGCGAVSDVVRVLTPFLTDFLQFLCSGCDTERLMGKCDPKKIIGNPRKAFNSMCGIKEADDAMEKCVRTAAGTQAPCSSVPAMLDKLNKLSVHKMIREACAVETQVKYAETYKSWSCKAGKGKRATPLEDSQRTRRGGGDALQDLWTALQQHF